MLQPKLKSKSMTPGIPLRTLAWALMLAAPPAGTLKQAEFAVVSSPSVSVSSSIEPEPEFPSASSLFHDRVPVLASMTSV